MSGLVDAELAVRRAVRQSLSDLTPDDVVLVAVSGGPDSSALAHATRVEGDRRGLRVGALTIDHGLQEGSPQRARAVANWLVAEGFDPVEVHYVRVAAADGPEADARAARYRALEAAAVRWDATGRQAVVLLGHTLDDQAEQVLLGLARGSGARSLAGMAPVRGRYRRPMLGVAREVVNAAVPAGTPVWHDPHNLDPSFARVRVRASLLPALEAELGPGVAAALARTADMLRADADALDGWASAVADELLAYPDRPDRPADGSHGQASPPAQVLLPQAERPQEIEVPVAGLSTLPEAVRTRVLRRLAISAGAPATRLTRAHVRSVDALVTQWSGQGPVALPGPVQVSRESANVCFRQGQ